MTDHLSRHAGVERRVHVTQTPENEALHRINEATATDREVRLARALQLAAFHGRPGPMGKPLEGAFKPAPLYLHQAIAISRDADVRAMVAGFIVAQNRESLQDGGPMHAHFLGGARG
jgi:hypothetical protein